MSNKLNVENLSTININAKIVKFNSHVNVYKNSGALELISI